MLSVSARDVRLEFPIYTHYTRSLKHRFGLGRIANNLNQAIYRHRVGGNINIGVTGKTVVTALNGVSFEIEEGDRVGMIGHNGSGKTTLLRAIAGIYEPVTGEITVRGVIRPLFDLQLGMDADATGLENIWLRGRMLDLHRKQINDVIDDIAEFTELGDYLHMPIRTYSAGMLVRLGFGIATALKPEILILDEMIGAGDDAFFDRARARLHRFIEQTGILIVASHQMSVLRQWCNKGMLLDQGNLVMYGPIEDAIKAYEAHN